MVASGHVSGLSVRPYAFYRLTLGDIGILRTRLRVRLLNRGSSGRDNDRPGACCGISPGVSRDNAALLCALLLLPERARIRSIVPRGQ